MKDCGNLVTNMVSFFAQLTNWLSVYSCSLVARVLTAKTGKVLVLRGKLRQPNLSMINGSVYPNLLTYLNYESTDHRGIQEPSDRKDLSK